MLINRNPNGVGRGRPEEVRGVQSGVGSCSNDPANEDTWEDQAAGRGITTPVLQVPTGDSGTTSLKAWSLSSIKMYVTLYECHQQPIPAIRQHLRGK